MDVTPKGKEPLLFLLDLVLTYIQEPKAFA